MVKMADFECCKKQTTESIPKTKRISRCWKAGSAEVREKCVIRTATFCPMK